MAFELKPNRPLGQQLRRLLLAEIAAALAALRAAADQAPAEQAVHEARRHIKKARAGLRLLDGALACRPLADCDRALRAAGRGLSAARDAAVLRHTLAALAKPVPAKATVGALRRLRDAPPIRDAPALDAAARQAVHQALHQARVGLAKYDFTACDFTTILAAFATTYRAGRRALRRANATESAARLHAVRKALKHHGYQLRLLRAPWPESLGVFCAQADHAAALLGQHHDCAMLRQHLTASAGDTDDRMRVDALAGARQHDLAQAALDLCRRLYAENSRCYARRIQAYWEIARSGV